MIVVPIERTVSAPAADVFAFLSDMANNPEWQAGMQSCIWTSEPPIGVGSTYDQEAKFLGRKIVTSFEVVAHEPGTSITIESRSGPLDLHINRTVTPVDEGSCTVAARIQGQPTGLMRFTERLMAGKVTSSINADYDRLVARFA